MDHADHVTTKDGTKVYKKDAFLGLISDFGQEGRTENMTFEQLEQLVKDHANELWAFDPKQTQLIQYTFPFTSLYGKEDSVEDDEVDSFLPFFLDAEMEAIIKYLITKFVPQAEKFVGSLQQITVSDGALQWMRHTVTFFQTIRQQN